MDATKLKEVDMKKLITLLVILLLLTGCATSKFSMKGPDGSMMTVENYVVTETYVEGKLTKRLLVPAKSILEGALDKIKTVISSILEMDGAAGNVITGAIK